MEENEKTTPAVGSAARFSVSPAGDGMTTLYTIGYEGRGTAQRIEPGHSAMEPRYAATGIASLIRALEERYIDTLVDVRRNPVSRNPQFIKAPLSLALLQAGIEYQHFPQLGISAAARNHGERQSVLDSYERRIRTHPWFGPFKGLDGATAIMCVEADPEQCHRSRLARVLADRYGYEVVHIPTTRASEEDIAS